MNPRLPVLLLALAACVPEDPPDRDGKPTPPTVDPTTTSTSTGSPTTTPPEPLQLTWEGPALSLEPGVFSHHATVALDATGTGWVGYQRNWYVRIATDEGAVIHDSTPAFFDHPQVAAAGDRVAGVSSWTGGGVNLLGWDLSGERLGEPIWLPTLGGTFPDLSLDEAGGVAAWSDEDRVGCARLATDLSTASALPCPDVLVAGRAISGVAVDERAEGGWLAWSEAGPGTPATVVLAALGVGGATESAAIATAIHPTRDARPDVVTTPDGAALLAWRGSDDPVSPPGAWLAWVSEPASPDWILELAADADRPDLARAGDLAGVVWDRDDGIWLQWIELGSGSLWGEPVEVTESDQPVMRPNLALRETADGWIGLVSWEAKVSDELAEVHTRRFSVALP